MAAFRADALHRRDACRARRAVSKNQTELKRAFDDYEACVRDAFTSLELREFRGAAFAAASADGILIGEAKRA